ncbi:MAG: glycosyltransferase family 2 protein [Alphaproteobacteria bacterium]|nr:MAG: glycosyltransferase family 2 protein [Alphaproteobacteria bacterium]
MPEFNQITVAIVAHNAAPTIARAVMSALADGDAPILLVDDHSTDGTAGIAAEVAGQRLTIVKPDVKAGVANARQTALANIRTPYGIWLDADDEFMPGRTARHLAMLQAGHDLTYDGCDLVDGATGRVTQQAEIPGFLLKDGKLGRQAERNWLPSLHCGFDVAFARKVGFDTSFQAAEDYDFHLRSLMAGARIGLIADIGYRYYHYAGSLSRKLGQAVNFFEQGQRKHGPDSLAAMMAANLSDAELAYTMAAWAISSRQETLAAKWLETIASSDAPIAPYSQPAADLAAFLAGTMRLRLGHAKEAVAVLEALYVRWPDATVANNLGVALMQAGKPDAACACWQKALDGKPGYLDATLNISGVLGVDALRYTALPLRPLASRADYSPRK